nr:hypothetical protein [uncultured Cohaesibacter sp.]
MSAIKSTPATERQIAPAPPMIRGAAKDNGGDGFKLHPCPGLRLGHGNARNRNDTGKTGCHARQAEGGDLDEVGSDTRQDCRFLVTANGKDAATEGRGIEREPSWPA